MNGLFVAFVLIAAAGDQDAPPSVPLVAFNSPESIARLERSKQKLDFFALANQYEGQANMGFCGPATATIVLNALRADNDKIPKPRDQALFPAEYRSKLPPGMDPVFSRYTQGTFFDPQTQAVKPRDVFFGKPRAPGEKPSPGLELRELHDILIAHGLHSELRVANADLTDRTIRRELVENLGRSGDFVIINYFRPALGQRGGGHISPLGAYDKKSDSFLVMDVNPNGQHWVWVPASDLFKAMRTPDLHEARGYLLVSEGQSAP